MNPINDSMWRAAQAGPVNVPWAVWFANYRSRHEFEVVEVMDAEGSEPTVVIRIAPGYKGLLDGREDALDA